MCKEVKKLPKRSEVKVEDTWRLEDIFATDEAWEAEFAAIKELIPNICEYKGKLGDSAEVLLAAFTLRDELQERGGKVYVYANMRHDQDTTDSIYQSQRMRATMMTTKFYTVISFIAPEILEIDESKLTSFLEQNEGLLLYKHELDRINNRRPHTLTADKEALLAEMDEVGDAASDIYDMLNDADLKFPIITDEAGNEVQITHGNYITLLESTDRSVRENAFKAMLGTYKSFENTFASTLSGAVKKNNFFAKTRNFSGARHGSLSENKIPEGVYDQLVATVNEYLPLFHRYLKLRKKMLGVDELHMYDMYAPLTPESRMTVTYEESVELVKESLRIMGDEYSDIIEEGFRERWVDVYENEGKRSGAYSFGIYGTPPYILMNWQDTVQELFTLAHEFGHSVHSYLTRKYQPFVYGSYSTFVAEVASTCNEELLTHYLLAKTTDKNDRLYLINNFLHGFRSTVFRQTMFAEFEQLIHKKAQEGVALTAEELTQMYYELNKKYYGEDVVVDTEIGLEWAWIPHFYYNFYVYQYATGNVAAIALSKQILDEGASATARYLEFLKAGCSDYPTRVLKKAGVDMTSKAPIEDAMAVFEDYLNQMEELIG